MLIQREREGEGGRERESVVCWVLELNVVYISRRLFHTSRPLIEFETVEFIDLLYASRTLSVLLPSGINALIKAALTT